jgi:hypothetical protein
MQAAWTAFATNGAPGNEQKWRPYADGGEVTLVDSPIELVKEIRGGRCGAVARLTTARR